MQDKLKILRHLTNMLEELKANPLPATYWIEESKQLDKMREANEKFERRICGENPHRMWN